MTIYAEDTNPIRSKKLFHGLTWQPERSPHRYGSPIGEYQACILSTHKVNTSGQFIQDTLEQRQLCRHLSVCMLFYLLQATLFRDISIHFQDSFLPPRPAMYHHLSACHSELGSITTCMDQFTLPLPLLL